MWLILTLVANPFHSAAQLAIDHSDFTLEPDQADQLVTVSLVNDGEPVPVTGIGFNVQVTDSGPSLAGSIPGPKISHVDVFSDTIFDSNNNGASGTGAFDGGQLYSTGTLTRSGTVEIPSAFSIIASITFDTTGFFDGEYTFTFDTLNGGVFYTSIGSDIQVASGPPGTLSIRPKNEPELATPPLEIGWNANGEFVLALPTDSFPPGQLLHRERLDQGEWREVKPTNPDIVRESESAHRWRLTPKGASNFFRWAPQEPSP